MTVKFKFDYMLNLHNRNTYIQAIDRDGVDEEVAYKKSLVQVNRFDIKSIDKGTDGAAIIMMKKNSMLLRTVEEYDEVIDTMQKANLALDIMKDKKVFIFDDFEVDSDELNICEGWDGILNEE